VCVARAAAVGACGGRAGAILGGVVGGEESVARVALKSERTVLEDVYGVLDRVYRHTLRPLDTVDAFRRSRCGRVSMRGGL
jgi:hypothetical protein